MSQQIDPENDMVRFSFYLPRKTRDALEKLQALIGKESLVETICSVLKVYESSKSGTEIDLEQARKEILEPVAPLWPGERKIAAAFLEAMQQLDEAKKDLKGRARAIDMFKQQLCECQEALKPLAQAEIQVIAKGPIAILNLSPEHREHAADVLKRQGADI